MLQVRASLPSPETLLNINSTPFPESRGPAHLHERVLTVIFFFFWLSHNFFFFFNFIFKLYIIVLVLPNIKMNPPQVCMCSPP